MTRRNYSAVLKKAGSIDFASMSRHERMVTSADLLWEELSETGVSWVGYYTAGGPGVDSLDLGPHRDKPACTPIGLHGACGQAFLQKQQIIVEDVRLLGENYIACDPRDLSEVVIPLQENDGYVWGVLDLDSHDTHAFDQSDADSLQNLMNLVFAGTQADA